MKFVLLYWPNHFLKGEIIQPKGNKVPGECKEVNSGQHSAVDSSACKIRLIISRGVRSVGNVERLVAGGKSEHSYNSGKQRIGAS